MRNALPSSCGRYYKLNIWRGLSLKEALFVCVRVRACLHVFLTWCFCPLKFIWWWPLPVEWHCKETHICSFSVPFLINLDYIGIYKKNFYNVLTCFTFLLIIDQAQSICCLHQLETLVIYICICSLGFYQTIYLSQTIAIWTLAIFR